MKLTIPLALAPCLLLAAAGDVTIAPGKWTATVEILDITMANAPPGVAAAMKGRPITTSYCVTPEQARQGVRGALRAESGCRFTAFDVIGNRVQTRMSCNRPTGTMTAISGGTYTPTGYAMSSTMSATGQMAMTMKSRATGRRIGPC